MLSDDSELPGYPPSLSRVVANRMMKPCGLSYELSAQCGICSYLFDIKADQFVIAGQTNKCVGVVIVFASMMSYMT